MEDSSGPESHPESQSLTDRHVDGLLLSSKKIRYRNRKACYPCNKRKIKCDRDEQPNGQPCSNCQKRPHPELCSYEDSNPRSSGGSTRSTAHSSKPATPSHNAYQQARPHVQDQPVRSGAHAASAAYGADRFHPQDHDHGASYTPYYGDNSASHASTPYSAKASASPFTGPGHPPQPNYQPARSETNFPARTAPVFLAQPAPSAANAVYQAQRSTDLKDEIHSLLPPQKHILPYFGIYRTLCAPLNPIILDLDDFEANVCNQVVGLANGQLLDTIVSSSGHTQESTLTQLGLLLATIASGIQYSDVPLAERSQLLQQYTRNSFHCLRLANFMLRPSFISLQTLLLLATILQNGLEPEAAWATLSSTRALAQSLRLDADRLRDANGKDELDPRLEIGSAVAWQDNYLATCFGRRPTGLVDINFSFSRSKSEDLDYKKCLHVLTETIATIHHHPLEKADVLEDTLSCFRNLSGHVLPHLQGQDHCRSIQNRIEYFAFRIQSSFVDTSLTLKEAHSGIAQSPERKAKTVEACRTSCLQTVQAFLNMHTFTVIPLRTWTFLHNALVSALLLSHLGSRDGSDERAAQSSLLATLIRSEEEGVTPQNFRRCFGRALDGLARMVSPSYPSEREGGRGKEVDVEMSDQAGPRNASASASGAMPDLASFWEEYFADISTMGPDSNIELAQQSAWGL